MKEGGGERVIIGIAYSSASRRVGSRELWA